MALRLLDAQHNYTNEEARWGYATIVPCIAKIVDRDDEDEGGDVDLEDWPSEFPKEIDDEAVNNMLHLHLGVSFFG